MIYFELRSKVPLLIKNEEIEQILEKTLTALGKESDDDRTISIVSVGPKEMRKLNFAARGKDEATDVLAFPLGEMDSFISAPYVNSFFGEVIICPSVAARKAKLRGMSKQSYQQLLLVHGLLHLFGLDHGGEAEAIKMENLEKKILQN